MIHQTLFTPKSIAIIGGSPDVEKPGGKLIKNLLQNGFKGNLYAVNPKFTEVQGIKCFQSVTDLPQTDLAILAIAAKFCPETVEVLASQKQTRAFIVISAGFSEENAEGAALEHQMVETVNRYGASLIGPNCIGVLTPAYSGAFTTPTPKLIPKGCDFISGSGATAVFIMESATPNGLPFANVFSVGNSAQLGVEHVLQHLDETFDPETSSHIKLLYIESVRNPQMLLKHAASLIKKGCHIAAIKAGSTDAGSRAATSHTGALANSDTAVDALFKKAGIVRCYSRTQLANVASIMLQPLPKGKNIAIVTHAGGPAVMLTDALTKGGFLVPPIKGEKAQELLKKLYAGSSVANPIDFLATGTAEQLDHILEACQNDFDDIDATCVIFGSSGLFPVGEVYKVLHQKIQDGKKPVYAILPSVINAKTEIEQFLNMGHVNFADEVQFAESLIAVQKNTSITINDDAKIEVDRPLVRQIINESTNGYLSPDKVQKLLDAAFIPRVQEYVANNVDQALEMAQNAGFPLVMKVVGPIHKSDVGGVVLNVNSAEHVEREFKRMIEIPNTTAIMIQPQVSGLQLFAGAKREGAFGHLIMCGLGGIFIEVLKDVQTRLAPVSQTEALQMVESLKSYPILNGIRGQEPINIGAFIKTITQLSALCSVASEIVELDLNPLLGTKTGVVAVDARIRIEK